jgi:bile acid transporter
MRLSTLNHQLSTHRALAFELGVLYTSLLGRDKFTLTPGWMLDMQSALRLFTNLYPLWTIGASLAGYYAPDLFLWFSGPWIVWGLTAIMLGMGLTLSLADFRRVWEMPRPVGLGFAAQYTIMPASAWLIARSLQLDTPLAVGLILVACCPGGTASNLVTYLARANVALSVVLTMVSTLLAIVMTPLLTKYWAGHLVPVDAWGIFLSTVQVVLMPILIGVYCNQRFPQAARAVANVGPAVAVLVIALIAGSIVAQNVDSIAQHGVQLAIGAALLHSAGFVLGYGVTRALGFPKMEARTVSIEVGMQNSGLATVLAKQHFASTPLTAAPAVFSSIFHSLIGSLCAAYWRMRPVVEAQRPEPNATNANTVPPLRDRREIYYWKCDRPAAFYGTNPQERSAPAAEVLSLLEPLLRRRLEDHELTLQDARSQGNHLTYLADSAGVRYFVRVENGPEQDDYMEIEAHVFDAVRETGVPTPQVLLADSSRTEAPFAYQVFEFVPHPDLNRLDKQGELAAPIIAEQIGRYVAAWQSVQPTGFGPFDPARLRQTGELEGLHTNYESYFRLNWEKHLNFLVENDFLAADDRRAFQTIVDQHADLLRIEQGCLVHKDLALWNILGTRDEITAVIDWDDAIAGDPTDDLSLLACFHSAEFLDRVIEGYESVRPLPENFLRRFWLHLLRNMVVKATIRVGAGYFRMGDDFFLLPAGTNGKMLERFTRDRLRLAYEGLRDDKPLSELVSYEESQV